MPSFDGKNKRYYAMENSRFVSRTPPSSSMPQPQPAILQLPPYLSPPPAVPHQPRHTPCSVPPVFQSSRASALPRGRQSSSSRPQSPYASPPLPTPYKTHRSNLSQSHTLVQGLKINQFPMTPLNQQPVGGFGYNPPSHPPHSVANLPPSLAVAHSSPSTPSAFGNVGSDYFSAGIPGLPPLANELRARFEQQGLELEKEKARSTPNDESTIQSTSFVRPQPITQSDTPISQQTHRLTEPSPQVQPPQHHHHHQNGQVASDLFAQEADNRWPLDRVVHWLAQNGFSTYWQEAFRKLQIEGLGFIELAGGVNGRLNYSQMFERVYPQIKSLAIEHGTEYDSHHEREEGRRLRKLLRRMVNNGTLDDSSFTDSLGPSKQLQISIPSASTDGGLESSPGGQGNIYSESPPLAHSSIISHDLPSFDQTEGEVWSNNIGVTPGGRSASGLHRGIYGTPDDRRRHSRTPSYDSGIAPSSYRSVSDGTHLSGGSPASRYPYTDLPEPSVDLRTAFSHSKQNSWESISSQGTTTHQLQHQYRSLAGPRPVPEMQRASPLEAQKHSGDRDHGKGFLGMFSRKKKSDLQLYHDDDSPTSPHPYGVRYAAGSSVFPRSGYVNDAPSADRPLSSLSEHDRLYTQSKRTSPPSRRYIFVTQDGWNYRLVDVTDFETPDVLRATLCQAVGISDPSTASLFLTEPGQSAHLDPLNDAALSMHRRSRSDSQGSLKLFIHNHANAGKYSSALTPNSALSSPEKRPVSSVLSEEEFGKSVSHGASSEPPPVDKHSHPPSESDLMAAHEQYIQEVERKQKAYLHHRHEQNSRAAKATSLGIKRDGIIDFDAPRASPYQDEKRAEKAAAADVNNYTLVPRRKPPSAPSESHTLTKVNSLRKSNGPELIKRKPVENVPESPVKHEPPIAPVPAPPLTAGNRVISYSAGQKYPSSSGSPRLSVLGRPQSRQVSMPVTSELNRKRLHEREYSYPQSPKQNASTYPLEEQHQYRPRQYQAQVPQHMPVQSLKSPPRLQRLTPPRAIVESISDDEGLFAIPLKERANEQIAAKPEIDDPDQGLFAVKPRRMQAQEEDGPDEGLFAKPLDKDQPKNDESSRSNHDHDSDLSAVPMSTKVEEQNATTVDADEEDDDLFAVPLNNRKQESNQEGEGEDDNDGDDLFAVPLTQRSNLSSNTLARSSPKTSSLSDSTTKGRKKTTSVSFVEPEPREQLDKTSDHHRSCILGDDVWASRPPVEGMIERLDDFFPNVDLDEPILEGNATPPILSPVDNTSREDVPQTISESPMQRNVSNMGSDPFPPYILDSTDTSGSSYVSVRNPDNNITIQRRLPRPNGGLGRMRSIRQVARGTHELHRQQSIRAAAMSANARPNGPILRRKSTKMFGAKILEIKPRNGRRLSQLDPIPQDVPTTGSTPKRQPTFRIVRGNLIGKGTYGKVFAALNISTGDIIAVKQVEINHNLVRDNKEKVRELVAALDQEIDTMQHLEHPNIVQYLGCEREEMSISIFLEYISGGSVGSCLRKHGKFEERIVRSLTRQTLDGLAYLHDQGILHRDLKADNILLDVTGTCKISDFGISKKTDDIYGMDATNSMQGSVFWMAPEVIRGQGYSAKVDIWSLGCVVLEMFAGRRPWEKEEMIGAIFKLGSLQEAPPIPDDVRNSISPSGLGLMWDCFTVDPRDRPTASTLLQHEFCTFDPNFDFEQTELFAKINPKTSNEVSNTSQDNQNNNNANKKNDSA